MLAPHAPPHALFVLARPTAPPVPDGMTTSELGVTSPRAALPTGANVTVCAIGSAKPSNSAMTDPSRTAPGLAADGGDTAVRTGSPMSPFSAEHAATNVAPDATH